MAFGSGPFGLTTFGTTATAVADQDITTLSTSRKIDADGLYEANDDGGFVAMNDTSQRVLLLVSFGIGPLPGHISRQALSDVEARARRALVPMTKNPNPEVSVRAITASEAAQGTVEILVDYVNLRTGTRETASKTL